MERIELLRFIRDSNRIEGIVRSPTMEEIVAHESIVALGEVKVADLQMFVSAVQPNAVLRLHDGLNVRVGDHIAPTGGQNILYALDALLDEQGTAEPFDLHRRYESLHPFTDGNGRSGRALWLWMMQDRDEMATVEGLGFLHSWYYQSLAASS